MAFVYRSQKSSLFDSKKLDFTSDISQKLKNEQSQLNGTIYDDSTQNHSQASPKKVVKGLPSLLGKQKIIRNQLLSLQQQDLLISQQKPQKLKINMQKLNKITQNYFFSSKVMRQTFSSPFKQLNKNQTCKQFNTNQNKCDLSFQIKVGQLIKQTTLNRIVNKNLISTKYENKFDFQKYSMQNLKNKQQPDNILINCSRQKVQQIKRKSSPPKSYDKVSQHLIKGNSKGFRQSMQGNLNNNQNQIFMKTTLQSNDVSLRRSRTQKRLGKLHKGSLQTTFYRQSESEQSTEQYQEQAPGPGSYNNTTNLSKKKSFRSRQQKFAKIFVSPLQRFKDQVRFQQITLVNQQQPFLTKFKENRTFISRTPKLQTLQKRNCSPPPGTYNLRQSMEHDIMTKLLRNINVPNFASSSPRFKSPKLEGTPGPGQYNIDTLQNVRLEQLRNQMSPSYKSQVKRCPQKTTVGKIKQDKTNKTQIQLLSGKQLGKVAIHQRQQHFDSSQFFTAPPFLSGAQRFQQPVKCQNSNYLPKSQKGSFIKQVKNNMPFNSSQKRNLQQTIGHVGVGVGSYIVQKDTWNKKSYNVSFE